MNTTKKTTTSTAITAKTENVERARDDDDDCSDATDCERRPDCVCECRLNMCVCVSVYVFVLRRVIAVCARARLDNRGSRSKSVLKYRFTERRSQSLQDVSDNSHIYLYARTHTDTAYTAPRRMIGRERTHMRVLSARRGIRTRLYARSYVHIYLME